MSARGVENEMKKVLERRAIAALAAGMAFALLAACGGNDGGEAAANDGGVTSITVLRSPASGFEALFIAESEGIFEKYDLDVTIQEGGAPQEAMPLLVNGQAAFAQTDLASLASAMNGGIPVTAAFPLQNALEGQDTAGLWVRADSGIDSLTELEGKSLAVPGAGGTPHITTLYGMEQEGADSSTVKVVDIPIASQAESLANGDVDAAYLIGAFHYGAKSNPDLEYLGNTTTEYIPGTPEIVWGASKQFTEENPEVVQAFTDALSEAYEVANENKEARREVMREVTEMPEEFIANADLPDYQLSFPGEATETFLDAMVSFEFIDAAPSLDELFGADAPVE
jgi:NitT/TauT family transport system substrate-binding protein